ncbi:MAG: hypothetical protein EOP46_15275 [Sphingobacteriaceae bacterium]|nr:MAG: hypothetical protein EOP46_15275 [Sphingobacteriaceae bacterium]
MRYKGLIIVIIISILLSCKGKVEPKEVVYKGYKIAHMRKLLAGTWEPQFYKLKKDEKRVLYVFEFLKNDFGVYQDMTDEGDGRYVTMSCAPTFTILSKEGQLYLKFVSMFSPSDTLQIRTISNKRLVLANDSVEHMYIKREIFN